MPLSTLFAPQVGLKPKAELCRRMSTALRAGIDSRTAWTREAERSHGLLRRHLLTVSEAVRRGETVSAGLAATGEYFPPLFHELVNVGEQTGNLDAVLAQLAEHHENQLTLRRRLFGMLAWPILELTIAIVFIGLMIWFMPDIQRLVQNKDFDALHLGLVGTRGLIIYLTFLAGVAAAIWLFFRAMNRGVLWVGPVQSLLLRLPKVGQPLQTLALSRLAWAMHLTLNTGMPVRRAIALSLRSTQNAYYISQIPAIDAEIATGHSLYEAFYSTGAYPASFLDTLAVGEESGETVEAMERLAAQYVEQARTAMTALTIILGAVIYGAIALVLIILIIRIAISGYIGPINDQLRQMPH
jgi:type II secretory pathway component PulF